MRSCVRCPNKEDKLGEKMGLYIKVLGCLLLLIMAAGVLAIGTLQYRPPQQPSSETKIAERVVDSADWTTVGGDRGMSRFSPVAQLDRHTVGRLQVAWTYSTGEIARRGSAARRAKFQATPIFVNGSLVFCTPFNRVIALDPATGVERWTFDPEIATDARPANDFNCRGVAQWQDPAAVSDAACGSRIFTATNDRRLFALDAKTGQLCPTFGDAGHVRLPSSKPLDWPGEVQSVLAPAVIGDVVVVGSSVADSLRSDPPSGEVLAFDARTGLLRWRFDPIPGAEGRVGGGNVWSSISTDPERDLVFLPTSSPSPDFFGGNRVGDQSFVNAIVAVRGSTGDIVWSRQLVHHDLWDYDLPTAPTLFTFRGGGKNVPALVQPTKMGMLFVLNRETGEPLFPIEEMPVPQSDVPGERASPTQPFSALPAVASRSIVPADAFGITPWDRAACRDALSKGRNEGIYTPPSLSGTIVYPSTGGGPSWGGAAIDPATNTVIVNASNVVQRLTLVPADQYQTARADNPRDLQPQSGSPYAVRREVLVSPLGLPCNPPPWGTLTALNLDQGTLAWQVPLGTTSSLAPFGLAFPWGTPNLGGPLITGGGLVFMAATMEERLRAFDLSNGRELWSGELSASAQSTPMTYAAGGRQFVVIAAGGHSFLGTKRGDTLVAFALPPDAVR